MLLGTTCIYSHHGKIIVKTNTIFHIFLSNLRASAIIHGYYFPVFCWLNTSMLYITLLVNLDSHDEQSLLVLFKEALQQYRCYPRKSHFDGKSINEFLVKSCAKFRRHWMEKPCYALVSFLGWGTVSEITWQFELLLFRMCLMDLFCKKSAWRRIPVWQERHGIANMLPAALL